MPFWFSTDDWFFNYFIFYVLFHDFYQAPGVAPNIEEERRKKKEEEERKKKEEEDKKRKEKELKRAKEKAKEKGLVNIPDFGGNCLILIDR